MLCLILLRDIPNQFVIFEDRADTEKDVLLLSNMVEWYLNKITVDEIKFL